jgi:ketosteroid isomerase-like protein
MTPEEILDFARRFVATIQSEEAEAARAFYQPDAVIWHNTDKVEQSVERTIKAIAWFARKLPDRRYRVVRLEALSDGFVQQHVLEAVLPDGSAWAMPACVVVRLKDGRIARLDEYIDSADADALAVLGR